VVVNTVEKANTTHFHVIAPVMVFFIYKCGYPAYELSVPVFKDPAGNFRMTEGLIFAFIEYFVDIFIKRSNKIGIVFVDNYIHL
jgi:hypothetical protein